MIKNNKEFMKLLNQMLEKYNIKVQLGSAPDHIRSFYSSVEKDVFINLYNDELFIEDNYVQFILTLMKDNVKKINDDLGIEDVSYNEEIKEYELNDNVYITLQSVYQLYDSDKISRDDFYCDKRNQKTLNDIKNHEIKDKDLFSEIVIYFNKNILIKGYPARAWDIVSAVKPVIEEHLKRELTELESDLLIEFTCNKTVDYPISEIEDGFNIKNDALYYHKQYLLGNRKPKVLDDIKNNNEFAKTLTKMLKKYKIDFKLVKIDQEQAIVYDQKNNEVYINLNSKFTFINYFELIFTLINMNVMKINAKKGIKDHTFNKETNEIEPNQFFYETRFKIYGLYNSTHNGVFHDERNAKVINKFKQYEQDDFATFTRIKEYYYKKIIGINNAPLPYGIYLRIVLFTTSVFKRPLTSEEKTYLENYITFKANYEPMTEVGQGYRIDTDYCLWHNYTKLFSKK